MAKNDDAWTRSPSRINLKIIFLQNYQFFMNYAKGPVKIHLLEAEKITFDPWRIFQIASFYENTITYLITEIFKTWLISAYQVLQKL